jgi:vacuolar-type H+-ATPase subunit E/Vma4
MEDSVNDAEAIIVGILADADAEAARIEAEAAAYAEQSAARAAEQASAIARDAATKSESQAKAILADAAAKAAIERRKRSLLLQERLAGEIVERAARSISGMIGQPGYKDVLRGWITEAVIGLSAESAAVNASKDELALIDDALLRDAEKAALAATGKVTSLHKVEGDPTVGQGAYLIADGGRLAYDNRVATRFVRNRAEIRKRIYTALYDEGSRT